MAIAFVQKSVATGTAATSITTPVFGSATTVGNLLTAQTYSWSATGAMTPSASDSKSNSWTRDKLTTGSAAGGTQYAAISSSILTSAGTSHTVTYTFSATTDCQMVAAEFSGMTQTVDQSASNTAGSSTTSLTATTAATTNANDLLVTAFNASGSLGNAGISAPPQVNGSTTGVNSLAVEQDDSTINGGESSYAILAATGTQAINYTYTSDSTAGYVLVGIVYQGTAAGAAFVPSLALTGVGA